MIPIFLVLLAMSMSVLVWVGVEQTCRTRFSEGCVRSELAMRAPERDADMDVPGFQAENGMLVGGQNGTWFEGGQFPRLYQISLENDSYVQLDPVHSGGAVWGGGFNGTQLLVSGWGSDDGSQGPYIWLYDGAQVVTKGSLDYGQAASWDGGDVFAASYNGKDWLLTGLGSGPLPTYSNGATNHMALGTFNGSAFTDLSALVPHQQDAILYTNAWNGRYWLVGGGYQSTGVLFTLNGTTTVDLTKQITTAIRSFASVQTLAWNGQYWLIGGIGFLAKYDGHSFVDLTQQLTDSLSPDFQSVNAIAWYGQSWMIGGGTPIAQITTGNAWIASYDSAVLVNLSSVLPFSVIRREEASSILAMAAENGMWILGGYSGNHGILFAYDEGLLTDYSSLVRQFTYVNWVSAI